MTDPIDLDALAELARKATPGPWTCDWRGSPDDGTYTVETREPVYGYKIPASALASTDEFKQGYDNAAYIAAVSPDVMLRLIAVAKAAQRFVREWNEDDALQAALRALEGGMTAPSHSHRDVLIAMATALRRRDSRYTYERGDGVRVEGNLIDGTGMSGYSQRAELAALDAVLALIDFKPLEGEQ